MHIFLVLRAGLLFLLIPCVLFLMCFRPGRCVFVASLSFELVAPGLCVLFNLRVRFLSLCCVCVVFFALSIFSVPDVCFVVVAIDILLTC